MQHTEDHPNRICKSPNESERKCQFYLFFFLFGGGGEEVAGRRKSDSMARRLRKLRLNFVSRSAHNKLLACIIGDESFTAITLDTH